VQKIIGYYSTVHYDAVEAVSSSRARSPESTYIQYGTYKHASYVVFMNSYGVYETGKTTYIAARAVLAMIGPLSVDLSSARFRAYRI
jgi:hypothetical protein